MGLAKKTKVEGLWQPIPGYPNLEKTADLEKFKEEFPELSEKLDEEVTKKEDSDADFFKNKGKVRVDHTDGYTYQVSEFSGEYQITRWKKGSGRKGGRFGSGFIHTRIVKTFTGDIAGFEKLLKKQEADDKWEIVKIAEDAKGNVKSIFATLVKQYTPTAPATTTEEKKEESSESEEETTE